MIVLCGCLISLLSFGPRSSLGLFLTPQSQANGWGRDVFAVALAVQNLLWGLGQPFAGMLADRFGTLRVLCAGGVAYGLGLALMAYSTSPLMLNMSAGALIGFGLAGCSFGIVLSAFGKLMPERWRSLAFGAGTAAGSFGQFLFAPLTVLLIGGVGWQETLVIFGAVMLAVLPLSLALATPGSDQGARHGAAQQSLRQALAEAFGHRSYALLVLGYFTCGFQLAFITVHMPAYLVDRGLSSEIGGWTIAVIGLFNIVGLAGVGLAVQSVPEALPAFNDLFRPGIGNSGFRHVPGHCVFVHHVRRGHGSVLVVHDPADQWNHCIDVRHALVCDARRICFFQPPGRRISRRLAGRSDVRAHRIVRRGMVALDCCSASCRQRSTCRLSRSRAVPRMVAACETVPPD